MTIEEIIKRTEGLGILMQSVELFEIVKNIHPPINMLVFGLGNDSIFWHEVNKGGRTVFIEDHIKWLSRIRGKHPYLETYQVTYNTKREQWKDLIDKPDLLTLELPSEIESIKWDLIIVDGPMAFEDGKPGRMKSIYMASKLIKNGGDVFVHDVHREIEDVYCKKYLLDKNLVSDISDFSVLRHYRVLF